MSRRTEAVMVRAAMAQSPTNLPDILDGYRLIRFLGRGGFGEVWLCRSEAMGDYRALKWIPSSNSGRQDKEYQALLHYRKAAAALRTPCLLPIEHVGRSEAGLYYVMPLADGVQDLDPADPEWTPMSLATKLHARMEAPAWFSSAEVIGLIAPVLEGLRVLSEAGLVHRDVKPDNILFFHGKACLGDISLLGADATTITRHGTPGYTAPSWYHDGHPDMYGAAATLYSVLTGNAPDRMGRSAFLWPPQGEASLSGTERSEWQRLHGVIRRAIEEKVSERYVDFRAMAAAVAGQSEVVEVPKGRRVMMWSAVVATLFALAALTIGIIQSKKAGEDTAAHAKAEPTTKAEQTAPESLELSADQKADYQALAGMVIGYLQDGNYANALASVEELLATYPQSRTQPGYSVARAMALKGLGRIDEAKAELRKDVNLSPNITAMTSRKDLWEELGELEEAENDLGRVLNAFGPATFPLFLRADIRAQRADFAGVQSDRKAAYAMNEGDDEQRKLVDAMWRPLETKYSGYGEFLRSEGQDPGVPDEKEGLDPRDSEILGVFEQITSYITDPGIPLSSSAQAARAALAMELRESFAQGDYAGCLTRIDRTTDSIPALADVPVLSLFRALLLERLGRREESAKELDKPCHKEIDPKLPEVRSHLLVALGRKE